MTDDDGGVSDGESSSDFDGDLDEDVNLIMADVFGADNRSSVMLESSEEQWSLCTESGIERIDI